MSLICALEDLTTDPVERGKPKFSERCNYCPVDLPVEKVRLSVFCSDNLNTFSSDLRTQALIYVFAVFAVPNSVSHCAHDLQGES